MNKLFSGETQMEKMEILEKIKEFFQSKNVELEITTIEDTDGKLAFEIWFEKSLEMSEEEYHKLENLMSGFHFSLIDMWEDFGDDTYERKSYFGTQEYQNKEEVEVSIFYTRVWTKKNTIYFIDKIWIE